ncbi:hypothetical protein ACJJTC_003031 [Scirpophaga incertulas]
MPIEPEPQPQLAAPEPVVSSFPSNATALANGSRPVTSSSASSLFSEVTERPVGAIGEIEVTSNGPVSTTLSALSGLPPAPHPLAPNEKHVLGVKSGNVELDIDVLARALAAAGVGAGATASANAAAIAAAGAAMPAPPAGLTAVGEGQLSAAGAVTAAGSALVNGALPATGVVAFEGALPATGKVILTGNCGCGCPIC